MRFTSEKDEPRWMWDIYGTGVKRPVEPEWLDEWQRAVCKTPEPIKEVTLSAERYDEAKQYFKDLDAHQGRKITRPQVLQVMTMFGIVTVLRCES